MRALLSAVGTRGDVQPVVALALKVRELGHDVRLCVPPNFVEWVRSLGFSASPVGVEMRARPGAAALTEERLRRMRESMPDLSTDQFEAVNAAADGCDVILGGNAHQYAARSIAELRGVRYVTAVYAPVALPSPDHAPPPMPGTPWPSASADENLLRWGETAAAWNARALERVNHNRARLGLSAISDVLRYNLTDHPWLAADVGLAPVPATPGMEVFATGAWIFADSSALSQELESFLVAGDAPIYLGFGSMPAPGDFARTLIEGARAVGKRALLARGWAELSLIDDASDCLAIDDVNQQALFARVCAVVHHGGAGTTATAARAGVPQVVCPMFGDQFYWSSRVRALGIGASVAQLTPASLAAALREALVPAVRTRCREIASQLGTGGAMLAAQRLLSV